MASIASLTNVNNVNAILVNFEENITNYTCFFGMTDPNITKELETIRTWIENQEASSKEANRNKTISSFGEILEESAGHLKAITSRQPKEVMKGCLGIAGNIAKFVPGPYGAAVGALCRIFGSILSHSTPSEPDLATVFIEKIHEELQKFNQKLLSQRFEGLRSRLKIMILYLKSIRNTSKNYELETVEIPDKVLYETDFPQFIGEVSHNIIKLSQGCTEEDIDDCLRSLNVYCNAQTSLFLLLVNILATFRAIGRQKMFIQNLLDGQKEDARQKLNFLFVEKILSSSNATNREAKERMILHFKKNFHFFLEVDQFRESLGMTITSEIETIRKVVWEADLSCPKKIQHLYPQPQTQGSHHYFQLINHTDVPIRVVCDGKAGLEVNCSNVQPRSSLEHIATKSSWIFSISGFFIIYLDGKLRSLENMFEGGNLKVFEFALSNPPIGIRKTAVLEASWVLPSKNMLSYAIPPNYFSYNKKYYVVFGGCTGNQQSDDYPGKNGCHTWRFAVQEFDPLED